jgi:hypothetical protein
MPFQRTELKPNAKRASRDVIFPLLYVYHILRLPRGARQRGESNHIYEYISPCPPQTPLICRHFNVEIKKFGTSDANLVILHHQFTLAHQPTSLVRQRGNRSLYPAPRIQPGNIEDRRDWPIWSGGSRDHKRGEFQLSA